MNPFKLMRAYLILLVLCIVFFFSCSKKEDYQTEPLSAYVNLQPGKSITYRLDSTVTINFGNAMQVNSYLEKITIDAAVTDNLDRPSYRVFRAITDINGTGPWLQQGTLLYTLTNNSFEVVENNFRYLKLTLPIKQDITWRGNRYLPTLPYYTKYEFSNDGNIAEWDYTYTELDESVNFNGATVPNVLTVVQIDDSTNYPVSVPAAYGSLNRSVEKYAKGIGLVYQELTMLEYQPPSAPHPGYKGFGVKRSMVAHN